MNDEQLATEKVRLGKALRRSRVAAGQTQAEWSQQVRVSDARISEMERMSRAVRLDSLLEYADRCGYRLELVPKEK